MGVQEARGKVAEASRHHGREKQRSDREGDRGGRPERPGGDADMDGLGQVRRGEVIDGFDCLQEDLVMNAGIDWRPVEFM